MFVHTNIKVAKLQKFTSFVFLYESWSTVRLPAIASALVNQIS